MVDNCPSGRPLKNLNVTSTPVSIFEDDDNDDFKEPDLNTKFPLQKISTQFNTVIHNLINTDEAVSSSSCHQNYHNDENLNKSKIRKFYKSKRKFVVPKLLKCDDCDFKTKSSSNLKVHINMMHASDENIEWFECEECDFKGRSKQILKQHKYKHLIFNCEHCQFTTRSKTALQKHFNSKHAEDD